MSILAIRHRSDELLSAPQGRRGWVRWDVEASRGLPWNLLLLLFLVILCGGCASEATDPTGEELLNTYRRLAADAADPGDGYIDNFSAETIAGFERIRSAALAANRETILKKLSIQRLGSGAVSAGFGDLDQIDVASVLFLRAEYSAEELERADVMARLIDKGLVLPPRRHIAPVAEYIATAFKIALDKAKDASGSIKKHEVLRFAVREDNRWKLRPAGLGLLVEGAIGYLYSVLKSSRTDAEDRALQYSDLAWELGCASAVEGKCPPGPPLDEQLLGFAERVTGRKFGPDIWTPLSQRSAQNKG